MRPHTSVLAMAVAWLLAVPAHTSPRLAILLVDRASLSDIVRLTEGVRPRCAASVGWMVSRTRRLADGSETFGAANVLTMAAGGHVAAPEDVSLLPARSDWVATWRSLQDSHTGPEAWGALGRLANLVRNSGYRTAAVGNSDLPNRPIRNAYLLAAGSNGSPDHDFTVVPPLRDPRWPYGLRADTRRIVDTMAATFQYSGLVAVEVGDIARAHSYASFCAPSQAVRMRELALRSESEALSQLATLAECVIVVGVEPPSRLTGYRVVPIAVISHTAISASGLLTSSTTRTSGLISNLDFLPTVLQRMDISIPADVVGTAAKSLPAQSPESVLNRVAADWNWQVRARRLWAGSPLALSFILVALAWLTRRGMPPVWPKVAAFTLLMLLLAQTYAITPEFTTTALRLALSAVAGWAIVWHRSWLGALAIVAAVALTWAPVGGATPAIWGPMPAWGTRFYGAGNQAAAVALAIYLLACQLAGKQVRAAIALSAGFGLLAGVFWFRGVNGGAAAATFVGMVVALWVHLPHRRYRWVLMAGAMFAGIALVLTAPGHLGRISELGWEAVAKTSVSKLLFNARAMFSEWSVLLLAALGTLLETRHHATSAPSRRNGWDTTWTIVTVVAFVIKDLGIVFAAILTTVRCITTLVRVRDQGR